MTTPVVSMDEAGQTGENLLDATQPVFTLASVDLDEDEASDLVGRASRELHFVKARRRPAGQARVLELLNALPAERVKAITIHKPFMVTCKIIDQLLEPLMFAEGVDGYADGSLLALANLWHFTCDAAVGPSFLPDLHQLFVRAVRMRDPSSIDAFYACLGAAVRDDKLKVPLMREMWLLSRRHFDTLMGEQVLPLLEPGVPAAQGLVYEWARVHPNGFEVRHDHRNEINDWIRQLSHYYDASQPATDFTFRDGTTIRLPVPVTSFNTGTSHEHPSIQVADIVASAASHILRQRVLGGTDDPFAEQLLTTPVLDFIVSESSVWPNYEILESPPQPGPPGEFDRMNGWFRDAADSRG